MTWTTIDHAGSTFANLTVRCACRRACTATSQWTIHPYTVPSWHNKSGTCKEIDTISRRVNYAQLVWSIKIWNLRTRKYELSTRISRQTIHFRTATFYSVLQEVSRHEHVRGCGGKAPCVLDRSTSRFPTRLLYSRGDEYTQYEDGWGPRTAQMLVKKEQNVFHLPCVQPSFSAVRSTV